MMMFAIIFGLSMDYEIFLLSRVHEAWLRTGDAKASVAHALEITARVITCAALIMMSVFAAFVVSDNIVVKMLGLGLAVSVLIDATVVRLLMVPAVMTLLGSHAWWTPRLLDRFLPHIDTEGEEQLPARWTAARGRPAARGPAGRRHLSTRGVAAVTAVPGRLPICERPRIARSSNHGPVRRAWLGLVPRDPADAGHGRPAACRERGGGLGVRGQMGRCALHHQHLRRRHRPAGHPGGQRGHRHLPGAGAAG